MYICLCNGVTDGQVIQYLNEQNQNAKMNELRQELGLCGQCGKCGKAAHSLLKECKANQ